MQTLNEYNAKALRSVRENLLALLAARERQMAQDDGSAADYKEQLKRAQEEEASYNAT